MSHRDGIVKPTYFCLAFGRRYDTSYYRQCRHPNAFTSSLSNPCIYTRWCVKLDVCGEHILACCVSSFGTRWHVLRGTFSLAVVPIEELKSVYRNRFLSRKSLDLKRGCRLRSLISIWKYESANYGNMEMGGMLLESHGMVSWGYVCVVIGLTFALDFS